MGASICSFDANENFRNYESDVPHNNPNVPLNAPGHVSKEYPYVHKRSVNLF